MTKNPLSAAATLLEYCQQANLPQLMSEWEYEKNALLSPENILYGSAKPVWWRCERKHDWRISVNKRTSGRTICPFCARKTAWPGETDLKSLYPALAEEWHPAKNGDVLPSQIPPTSKRRYWWLCPEGHAWKAVIYSRAGKQKRGCQVCAGVVEAGTRKVPEACLSQEKGKRI